MGTWSVFSLHNHQHLIPYQAHGQCVTKINWVNNEWQRWGERIREGEMGGRESSGEGIQAANEGRWSVEWGWANLACPVLQVWLLWLPFLNHCLDHFLISLQAEESSHHLSRWCQHLGMLAIPPGTSSPTSAPSPGVGLSALVAAPWSPRVAGWWFPDSSWCSTGYSHKRLSGHPLESCEVGRHKQSIMGIGEDFPGEGPLCNHQLNIIIILRVEYLLCIWCWTKSFPGIKYHMPIGAHSYPYRTHFIDEKTEAQAY